MTALKTDTARSAALPSRQLARIAGLDLLRVLACFMVVLVHTDEFYYIAPNGILHDPANFWVAVYSSLCRCSVPLFVMISGFLLLPVSEAPSSFFKRKFTRVLYPFVFWCAIYALYPWIAEGASLSTALVNITKIPVNFGTEVGHLWYVYMLIGIYLFAPIISPWLQTASKRQIEFYLSLWALTGVIPYLHTIFPEIWGECYWNGTPMLFYFSGFLGYAVLGCYMKKFHLQPGKYDLPIGMLLVAIGYAITAGGFGQRLSTARSVPELELTWAFNTINVAMMALGTFLIFKNVRFGNPGGWKANLISDISVKSYGIYLAHILILNRVHATVAHSAANSTLLLPAQAAVTFISTYLIIKLISYIPKSRFIVSV